MFAAKNIYAVLIVICIFFKHENVMAQSSFNISIQKKQTIDCPPNLQSVAFSKDGSTWVAGRKNELIVNKKNSKTIITGIVYPPKIQFIDQQVYFGHKIFSLESQDFKSEGLLFEQLSSYFGSSYYLNIEHAQWILPTQQLLVHVAYNGPAREIDASSNYSGPKHRLLLYDLNTEKVVKEITQSDTAYNSIAGNKDFYAVLADELWVWNNKGNRVEKDFGSLQKLEFHQKHAVAAAIGANEDLLIWNTTTWHAIQIETPVKGKEIGFHPELSLLFVLTCDSILKTYHCSASTAVYLSQKKMPPNARLLGIDHNQLFLLSSSQKLDIFNIEINE